jgi:hypothetical protein
VLKWRGRYQWAGLAGLGDLERSGRPRNVDHCGIVSATLTAPPKKLGVTHWSSRLLATVLGIGKATVARAWREYGAQPWWEGTFRFSTDPELVAKVIDVVGLYLAPLDWPHTGASRFTSHQRPGPGSTSSKSGSPASTARLSGAGSSPPSKTGALPSGFRRGVVRGAF